MVSAFNSCFIFTPKIELENGYYAVEMNFIIYTDHILF